LYFFFFFNDTATTEIYTLSLRRSSDLETQTHILHRDPCYHLIFEHTDDSPAPILLSRH
jgi:hypothetical protein